MTLLVPMATSTQPVKRARGGGEGHASRRAVPEVGEVAALHRSRLADEEVLCAGRAGVA